MKTQNPLRLGFSARHLTIRVLLAALLWLLPAAANAQVIQAWVQRYNGPGNSTDQPQAIALDGSNNIIVTGLSYSSGGWDDYATIKYSNAGVPLWTNRYNGPANSDDRASGLAVDSSDNVIVTGYSDNDGNPSLSIYDYATIKYSSAGVALWTNLYNGPGNGGDLASALAVDGNNNVIVTGWSVGSGSASDCATIQYSSAGVALWTNRYNGPANSDDQATAVAVDGSDNIIVTGYSYGIGSGADYTTIKYSSAGAALWTNRYSGPGNNEDYSFAVAVDGSNNVVITGYSSTGANYDYLTIAYSSAGVPLWTNRYVRVGIVAFFASGLAVDGRNNVIVAGYSYGAAPNHDFLTIAYSSAGLPLWTNRYKGPGNGWDEARAIAVDSSGNVFVTGSSASGANNDYATIKYSVVPIITRQPLSRTNAVATTASFSVEVAGNLPFSYQWRQQGTNLVDGGNVSGVTSTNLLIGNVQLSDAAGYSVVVTNAYGSVTSSVAQLTVVVPPNPGRFTNLSYSQVMGFSFIFRDATVGKPYRIQTSRSLAEGSWVDWLNFNYNGPMLLTDLGAVESTNKFYRAVSP